ncbi:MAG: family efflux transporter, subunit [Planctomycetota bacterium]|nr:family efflux transporter, subunit [Planctomycetota bacterium]
MKWKLPIAAVTVAAVVAVITFNPWAQSHARNVWSKIVGAEKKLEAAELPSSPREVPKPFDGVIEFNDREYNALGLAMVPVRLQVEPLKLSVSGKTDYDPNTLNKVRPKFKSLIDKVYVEYGHDVKEGDPLVDLFSADLAEAKGLYETKMSQWEHDKIELARYTELFKSRSISEKELLTVQNDEKKSGTEAKIAKDKLMVFGLSEADIAAVAKEDGTKKAKMTLRAPGSGVVIGRDVVKGNLYDENDVLLTIAPLDHFWVYGYVYPSEASRVSLGQTWVIDCPFVGQQHRRPIESITSEIDKETKTVRIRTRIDNVAGKLKAEMLVGGWIEIPPPDKAKRTVIPRLAMVSADGGDYAFVLIPNQSADDAIRRFERRRIRVIYEGSDGVYVAEGTKPGEGLKEGEQVVTKGSLILMQLYEDAAIVEAGGPV